MIDLFDGGISGTVVAVVDPYSTGAQLAPALRRYGVRPVAVVSPGGPPAVSLADFRPADFDAVMYSDEVDPVAALAALRPVWVVPGAEEGVELADRLAAELTPGHDNVAGLGPARRHKGRAVETMSRAGLPVPRTASSAEEGAVAAWLDRYGLADRALVLKPPRSAAADGVVLVEPGGDWRPPFRKLRGWVNAFGVRDDEVVVQEYLTGEEYAVDTVSVDGRHVPVALFRYSKEFSRYRTVDVLPLHAPDLFDLAGHALDALGLRNGPAHTEVIRGPDGPKVIEVNARLHGGAAPAMSRLASGDSQLDRLTAVLAGHPLAAPAAVTRSVRAVYLCADRTGFCTPAGVSGFSEAVRRLPSFVGMELFVAAGSAVPRTVDLLTALGRILLAHDNPAQIDRDTERIREFEQGLVTAATEAVPA